MHAITQTQEGGPETLQWTEVATPKPGPGEVLVKTVAAGINRADSLQRRGYYPPPKGVTNVLGLEASGVVESVGEGVDNFAPGNPVVALLSGGAYAEYFVAPAGQLVPPPDNVELVESAALIEVAATVLSNLERVHLRKGETFLVHGGAGGIGAFAIQYAKYMGVRVITTASEAKLDYCRELGADVVIDYNTDWPERVKNATDGKGVDVILDIIGAKYLQPNVDCLAQDGRMVIIGMQKGVKGELNIGKLLNRRGTITATSLRFRPTEQKSEIAQAVREKIWPLYEDETLSLPDITVFPMENAAEAHEMLDSGQLMGKIVLAVDQPR